jgi:FkbM family methyltransferase
MADNALAGAAIGAKRRIARLFVRLLPTDVGLWRMKQYLPGTAGLPDEMVARLRGFPLRLTFRPRTYLGWHLFYRGIYEERIVRTCHRLLRPGMTFVDVGANVGLYSIIASNAVGPNGRVIAVEPQPDLAAMTARNASLNLQHNIDVNACALGESVGKAFLYQASTTNDGAATMRLGNGEISFGEPIAVTVETLSRLLQKREVSEVGGMKIDVEGAELAVLKGFSEELAKRRPEFIFVECIDAHLRRFGTTAEELLQFLQGCGFKLFCLYRGRWRHVRSCAEHAICSYSPDLLAIRMGTTSWQRFAPVLRQSR